MALESLKKTSNNITRFDIFPNSGGNPVSYLGGVIELYYYESVLSETVRMTLNIIDTGNVIDNGQAKTASEKIKLTGSEKVYIEFEDGLKQKVSFTTDNTALYISSRKRITDKLKEIEVIDLVSMEYLKNESVRVVERYDGKISESVKSILKNVLGTKKTLDIELTQNERSFIGTTKKPFWFVMWLASQSVPQKQNSLGKTGGYLFFETRKGFKYKSIDTLLAGTSDASVKEGGVSNRTRYKSFIYTNTASLSVPIGYSGKIVDFKFLNTADIKDQLTIGAFNSTVNLFNSLSSSFNCNPLDISIQESSITYAGTEYGKNLNKIVTENPSRYFTNLESVGGLKPIEQSRELDVDKSKFLAASSSRYNQLFTVKIEITIGGDFSLESGEIIFCDFPEVSNKKVPTYNPRMSGIYMISALCHRITPNETYTTLELIRDSYGRRPNQSMSLS